MNLDDNQLLPRPLPAKAHRRQRLPFVGIIVGISASQGRGTNKMSPGIHRLTDSAARNVTAAEKPQKLFDGAGLYLLVEPSGAKYWRMAYRFARKQRLLALGVYPDVTLRAARIAAVEARE